MQRILVTILHYYNDEELIISLNSFRLQPPFELEGLLPIQK